MAGWFVMKEDAKKKEKERQQENHASQPNSEQGCRMGKWRFHIEFIKYGVNKKRNKTG